MGERGPVWVVPGDGRHDRLEAVPADLAAEMAAADPGLRLVDPYVGRLWMARQIAAERVAQVRANRRAWGVTCAAEVFLAASFGLSHECAALAAEDMDHDELAAMGTAVLVLDELARRARTGDVGRRAVGVGAVGALAMAGAR